MPGSDAEYVRLGTELDPNSANQIKQFVGDVEQQFERLDRLLTSVGKSSNKAGQELVDGMRKSRQEIEAAGRAADNLGDKVQKASKASFGVEGLRRTGGALSQLGFGEVGGAVSRVGDIGQVGKEFSSLVESLGPLAPAATAATGAVLGFQVGLKVLEAETEAAQKGLADAVTGLDAYYKAIEKGTKASITQQIQELEERNKLEKRELKQLTEARVNATASEIKAHGLFIAGVENFVVGLTDSGKKLDERIAGLQKSTSDTDGQIQALKSSLGSAEVKIRDLADAFNGRFKTGVQSAIDLIKRLSDEYEKQQAKLGASLRKSGDIEINRIKADQQTNRELQTFTYEQAQQRIKAIEDEKAVNDKIILTRGLANSQLDRNSDAYKKNVEDIQAATAANQNLNRELKYLTDAMGNLPAEIEQRNARMAAIQQKYNDETTAAEQHAAEEKTAIHQKYVDATISATQRLADATTAALQQLKQSREDLLNGLRSDLSKGDREALDKEYEIQIKAHREEQKELTQHLARLKEIQDSANYEQVKDLLEGNFLGLFESRLQVKGQQKQENTTYGGRKAEIETSQQNEVEDLRHNIQVQRRERLISYDQALADAKLSYRRSLDQAEAARRTELQRAAEAQERELQQVNNKLNNEARLKYNAYVKELQQAATFGEARIKLQGQIEQALVNQANRTLAQVQSSSYAGSNSRSLGTIGRASGGMTYPGQLYQVNERAGQRESVNGIQFMGGQGVYLPFKSGYVNPGGTSAPGRSVSNTFYITSHDPQGVRAEVLSVLERVIG
jgi:hypothetical protein